MSKTTKIIIAVILVAVLGIGAYFIISSQVRNSRRLSFKEFQERVLDAWASDDVDETIEKVGKYSNDEQIVSVVVDGYTIKGYTKNNRQYWTNCNGQAYFPEVYLQKWEEQLKNEQGRELDDFDYSDPNAGSGWSTFLYIAILAVGIIMFIVVLRATSGGGKIASFGKTKAHVTSHIKVRFSDVAGAEEEKEELAEVVEFLKNPKKFSDLGAKIPKGVLLVGPPGTGKTLFARAVAGEAGVPFFSASGSDFVEMYVGVGASRVRDLFDLAKRNQPCIIFIDEIDAVGRQRGAGLGGGHDEREQTLNQILVQMDGFETNEGIIVMAATNRADILDNALLRPGRFDRQIYVNLPDVKGREQILKVHARNKPLAPDVNFKVLARMTSGFSGADLANLLNEAAILAARVGKKLIGNLELYEGINKVTMGPQKKSRVVTEADKKATAYHEAGHAILAKLCPYNDNVQEVSIIPRGMAAGYTLTRPEDDDSRYTVNRLNDFICMALGGRVAEEIVIHDVSAGASNDIQKVTQLARKMVTEWGMSDRLGPIAYSSDGPVFLGRDFEERNTYSEETAGVIDEEVKAIVGRAYARAKKLLLESRSILDNMARVLVECETIYTAEVDMLMKGASYEEVIRYMEEHDRTAPDNPFGRVAAAIEAEDSKSKASSSDMGATSSVEGQNEVSKQEDHVQNTEEIPPKNDEDGKSE